MAIRLVGVLAPLAGLAVLGLPGALTPVAAPAEAECAGGICDVCPAVARALGPAGTEITCLA